MSEHILICGERGVGKSTLIARLAEKSTRPLCGFVTRKLEADETGFHPIYIHPAGRPVQLREYTAENLVGNCNQKIHDINTEVFNTLGAQYLAAPKNGLIIMDELGFMEAKAEAFTKRVLAALDGDVPVIAAVKARFDVHFLNEVRRHPNCRLYMLQESNREALYTELLPWVISLNE